MSMAQKEMTFYGASASIREWSDNAAARGGRCFVSCAAVCIGVRAECLSRYLPVIAECSFAARGFDVTRPGAKDPRCGQ